MPLKIFYEIINFFHLLLIINKIEALAKVFFCGSTSSPRTEKLNNFNLSPFTLSLSKGKLRTFVRSSITKKIS